MNKQRINNNRFTLHSFNETYYKRELNALDAYILACTDIQSSLQRVLIGEFIQ